MTETVQLFITCIIDTFYPQTGEAVVAVLRRAGAEVGFPAGQTCCGQPAFNAGLRAEARRMAEQTIRVLENTPGKIVIPSGSCTAMIQHGYQELFRQDPAWLARARAVAERSHEFTAFLVDVLGVTELGAVFPATVTYHSSCHLNRDLGIQHQPLQLLQSVGQLHLVELPASENCCGFGGVFSVEHAEISGAMLNDKLAKIALTGAEIVVACDAGCLTQINGGLRRQGNNARALHIAEILAARLPAR